MLQVFPPGGNPNGGSILDGSQIAGAPLPTACRGRLSAGSDAAAAGLHASPGISAVDPSKRSSLDRSICGPLCRPWPPWARRPTHSRLRAEKHHQPIDPNHRGPEKLRLSVSRRSGGGYDSRRRYTQGILRPTKRPFRTGRWSTDDPYRRRVGRCCRSPFLPFGDDAATRVG